MADLLRRQMLPRDSFLPLCREALQKELGELISCLIIDEVSSTQEVLKENPGISLCVAEYQTAGRGRNGEWTAPYGANLLLSLRLELKSASLIEGLSLCCGLAVRQGLADCLSLDLTSDLKVKWPNDILYQGKKLGGILLEGFSRGNRREFILGVGCNVNMDVPALLKLSRPATSLYEMSGQYYDRNKIAAAIIRAVRRHWLLFEQTGFESFSTEWQMHDALRGQLISLSVDGYQLEGRYWGVNAQGALQLQTLEGMRSFSMGEASGIRVP